MSAKTPDIPSLLCFNPVVDSVTNLLQQLVRIPSVNPDGDPGTDQCGEEKLALWLGEFLDAEGFTVTMEEVKPGRPNLIARGPGPQTDNRPRIEPFGGDISGGKLWGRGASDTKGPMAAMIWGLLRNREHLADLPVAVDFVAFMSEESDQFGSKHFAREHAGNYEFAIAGEPTELELVHTTKGSLWAVLEATGVSGHSSQPESGENAIMKMVDALMSLEEKLNPLLSEFTHPVLGPATLNVGIINGGTRANIIPDRATAQIDIRYPPSLSGKCPATELLEEFIARNGLPISLSVSADNPPMEVDADHPWLRRILAVHPHSKLVGAPWFSDAAHLNDGGLPAICLGPGSIRQAHTRDEFIRITDLEAGADYFTELVANLQA